MSDFFEDPAKPSVPRDPALEQDDPRDFEPPPPGNTGCRNALIGCGIIAVILLILGIVGGIVVSMNWRTWTSDFTVNLAQQAIEKSEIPAEGKERLKLRIKQVADDFKAGRLSTEQIGLIVKKVVESPLLVVALATGAEQQYVKPSGLSNEEKQAAGRTLQRFARGMFEKKIDSAKQQSVMNLVMEDDGAGRQKLKQTMTDDELRIFLSKAQEVADESAIPDEPFEVDIAAEIEKAIDEAIKRP